MQNKPSTKRISSVALICRASCSWLSEVFPTGCGRWRIVADNGPGWFLSGAPDRRWSDDDLGLLKNIKGFNFEVVRMGRIITKE